MRPALVLSLAVSAVEAQFGSIPIIFPQDIPSCRPLRAGETFSDPAPPALPTETIVFNNLGGVPGMDNPAPPSGASWPQGIRIRQIARHPQFPNDASRWVDVFITNTTNYLPRNPINRMHQGWLSVNLEGPEPDWGWAYNSVRLKFQAIDGATPELEQNPTSLTMTGSPGVLGLWDMDTEGQDPPNPRGELNGRECVSAPRSAAFNPATALAVA